VARDGPGTSAMMLMLALAFMLAGLPLLKFDRRLAHYFRERLPQSVKDVAYRTTDYAKGGPWIIAAVLFYAATQIWIALADTGPVARSVSDIALALVVSFVLGSVVLHTIKIFLGRRRPRDDFEHGLYGFRFFTWELQYNSFPSGHAMTIFAMATLLTAIIPALGALWFAVAIYLGLTRAFLTAHFLSDVAIGAGIGILATRQTLASFFPPLMPVWF